MSKTVMIKNGTDYPMSEVYEYLAGYTTKLLGKIKLYTEFGQYYDVIVISNTI